MAALVYVKKTRNTEPSIQTSGKAEVLCLKCSDKQTKRFRLNLGDISTSKGFVNLTEKGSCFKLTGFLKETHPNSQLGKTDHSPS